MLNVTLLPCILSPAVFPEALFMAFYFSSSTLLPQYSTTLISSLSLDHLQLQVERRTEKVRRPKTDVLPLCHATNRGQAKAQTATAQCVVGNW